MILVTQAIGLVRLISEYDIIFTTLGGEYKAAQNRFHELGVLPKFHGKNLLKIQEYPSVDGFLVFKLSVWFIVKWFTVADVLYTQSYVYHYRGKQGRFVTVLWFRDFLARPVLPINGS